MVQNRVLSGMRHNCYPDCMLSFIYLFIFLCVWKPGLNILWLDGCRFLAVRCKPSAAILYCLTAQVIGFKQFLAAGVCLLLNAYVILCLLWPWSAQLKLFIYKPGIVWVFGFVSFCLFGGLVLLGFVCLGSCLGFVCLFWWFVGVFCKVEIQ